MMRLIADYVEHRRVVPRWIQAVSLARHRLISQQQQLPHSRDGVFCQLCQRLFHCFGDCVLQWRIGPPRAVSARRNDAEGGRLDRRLGRLDRRLGQLRTYLSPSFLQPFLAGGLNAFHPRVEALLFLLELRCPICLKVRQFCCQSLLLLLQDAHMMALSALGLLAQNPLQREHGSQRRAEPILHTMHFFTPTRDGAARTATSTWYSSSHHV
jgi:hypothetical protein